MRFLETDTNLTPIYNPGIWPTLEWAPEFWMTLFDKLNYPVLILEEGGKIMFSNSEAGRLLNLEGLTGSNVPAYLKHLISNGFEVGRPKSRTVSVDTCDGIFRFNVKIFPYEGVGNLVMAAGIKEYQLWPAIDSSYDSLEQSVAMAGEVSQKVKGPLAGIELYASILDEELTDSGDNSLKVLINEIRDSLKSVNEYLTSFESMTRDIKLDLDNINLIEVIDEALDNMSALFKANNVGVWVDQRPVHVLGDRRLLVQLCMNLFLNSVEAMPSGGRLMIRMNQTADDQAEIIISDTGPGLDLGMDKKVFNPFYTTKGKDLGLGLPVSKRIVEAHNGHMTVGSEVSSGARVAVSLPGIATSPGSLNKAGLAQGQNLN
jgi:nitrogen-specific signal transduction histidine kinase